MLKSSFFFIFIIFFSPGNYCKPLIDFDKSAKNKKTLSLGEDEDLDEDEYLYLIPLIISAIPVCIAFYNHICKKINFKNPYSGERHITLNIEKTINALINKKYGLACTKHLLDIANKTDNPKKTMLKNIGHLAKKFGTEKANLNDPLNTKDIQQFFDQLLSLRGDFFNVERNDFKDLNGELISKKQLKEISLRTFNLFSDFLAQQQTKETAGCILNFIKGSVCKQATPDSCPITQNEFSSLLEPKT